LFGISTEQTGDVSRLPNDRRSRCVRDLLGREFGLVDRRRQVGHHLEAVRQRVPADDRALDAGVAADRRRLLPMPPRKLPAGDPRHCLLGRLGLDGYRSFVPPRLFRMYSRIETSPWALEKGVPLEVRSFESCCPRVLVLILRFAYITGSFPPNDQSN